MSKLKIGVQNFHFAEFFAELVKDDETGVQYKAPVHVPNIVNITLDKTTNSTTFYADNKPIEVSTTYGGTKVSLEIADLPLEVQAALLGHKIENGVLKRNSNDLAPYVAIMFEGDLADGTKEYVKLFKGMFRVPKLEYSTKKESPEFKSTTIEADFISRTFDGATEDAAQSDNDSATEIISAWYTYVDSSDTTVAAP